jgi:radical SAM superfamily enzyme YgiQ (UPF0313 family)
MKKGIIFAGVNYPDCARKGGGATRISNYCKPYGWDIEVVDYFPFWSDNDIKELLKKIVDPSTKFIGFSYTWLSQFDRIVEKIKLIKDLYPSMLIIVGGQTPYEQDLQADYYIYGYGEVATLAVLEYEFNNGPPVRYMPKFKGNLIDGLHDYYSGDLKEYGNSYNENDFLSSKDTLMIELSRGCKFSCKFCSFPYIGMKEDTSRSEESLYRELNENYQRWGIINYNIADDTFNDRTEKLIKLKNVVNRLDFKPNFNGYIRIDLFKAHPEQLEILSECNMWGHFYGIETFNHESGKIIGKGLHPDIVKELLIKTKEYFIKNNTYYRAQISMIAGLPKESIDSMRKSYQWLIDNFSDESPVWQPLELVKAKDTVQAFGKDLSKYGYRKIENLNSEQFVKSQNRNFITKLKEETVYWENDYTNCFEVYDLVEEFRKTSVGIANWALMSYLAHYSIEEALKIKTPPYDVYINELYASMTKKMIDNYISKKLNR